LRPTALTDTGVNPAGWPAAELCDANGCGSELIGGSLLTGAADAGAEAEAAPKSLGVAEALLAAATVGDALAVRRLPATSDP
jgi:hypothetical protein